MVRQDGWMLEAVSPGVIESGAWDEGAASEVVGGTLGLLVGCGALVAGVELVSAAVVDDVLELVQECEELANLGVVLVDADDPLTAVPVAHAAHWQLLVDDGDARQPSDVLLGDATELVAERLAHQDMAKTDGLAFGQTKGFIEGASSAGSQTAEALENTLLLVIVVHGLCLLSVKRLVVSARSCALQCGAVLRPDPICQAPPSAWGEPYGEYLQTIAQPVTPENLAEALETVKDLLETMHSQPLAVGLSANQIGSSLAIAVVRTPDEDLVLVNPRPASLSGKKDRKRESCMSIWGLAGEVERRDKAHVMYDDLELSPNEIRLKGFTSRVVQHELDHLNGVLYNSLVRGDLSPTELFAGHSPVPAEEKEG